MQLIEINTPGFYVVKDKELVLIHDEEYEDEAAERLLALKLHLDDFTSTMDIDGNRITVGACTKYQGVGPSEAEEMCATLRAALIEAVRAIPVGCVTQIGPGISRSDFNTASVADLQKYTYSSLVALLSVFNPESFNIGIHTVLNTLHFLTNPENKDINLTMREAWDGKSCASEWLVLTDSEANEAWDEDMQRYLEECVLPELPKATRCYFDEIAWKRDARFDGREGALSPYDGQEHSVDVNDTTYFIYRTN